MKTPINTAKAIDKALCEGKDNTTMTVALYERTAEFNYGSTNYKGILPPHVAIWVNRNDGELWTYPQCDYALITNNENELILIYEL